MQNNEQFVSLTEMGCSPILSEAAIKSLKTQDIMALLDWISANEDKEDHWKEWLANPPKEAEKVEGEKKEGDPIPIDTLVSAEHTQ